MLQHLIISLKFYYLSSGRLREVKNNFKLFSSKCGRSRLREVGAYNSFKYSDFTWKILVFWKTGH